MGPPYLVEDWLDTVGTSENDSRRASTHFANRMEPSLLSFEPCPTGSDAATPVPGYKLHKLADVLPSRDEAVLYTLLTTHWSDPQRVVLGASDAVSTNSLARNWPSLGGFEQNSMQMDILGYLPNDILVKLDRAAMAVSLEGTSSLPRSRCLCICMALAADDEDPQWTRQVDPSSNAGQIRSASTDRAPENGIRNSDRGCYLRGPLQNPAEALLSERRIREDAPAGSRTIRERWAEHLSGRKDWQYQIWDVLMLQSWLDDTRSQTTSPQVVQAEVARS